MKVVKKESIWLNKGRKSLFYTLSLLHNWKVDNFMENPAMVWSNMEKLLLTFIVSPQGESRCEVSNLDIHNFAQIKHFSYFWMIDFCDDESLDS